MRTHYCYKVVLERDQDVEENPFGWRIYCPALRDIGGSTRGETREEAANKICDVVHMIVERFIADGMALPEDDVEPKGTDQMRIVATAGTGIYSSILYCPFELDHTVVT